METATTTTTETATDPAAHLPEDRHELGSRLAISEEELEVAAGYLRDTDARIAEYTGASPVTGPSTRLLERAQLAVGRLEYTARTGIFRPGGEVVSLEHWLGYIGYGWASEVDDAAVDVASVISFLQGLADADEDDATWWTAISFLTGIEMTLRDVVALALTRRPEGGGDGADDEETRGGMYVCSVAADDEDWVPAPYGGWTLRPNLEWRRMMLRQAWVVGVVRGEFTFRDTLGQFVGALRGGPQYVKREA